MMITDKELAEYRSLYTMLRDLNKRFIEKKQEILRLLEEFAAQQRTAFSVLNRANRLNRYLTGRQRQVTGVTSCVKAPRIVKVHKSLPETQLPEFNENCQNKREVKQQGLLIIALINDIKKKLLQLELLEQRCRELILSMKKTLEAFRHESGNIQKKLFPFGAFSFLRRFFRRFFGRSFFTSRDLEDIAALGKLTGLVLKIANSPLI